MPKYRLHYAGSTFDLPAEKEGQSLLAKARAASHSGSGAVVTVNLVEGTLQLLLTSYVSLAVSTEPDDVPASSAYEEHGLLVV